MDPSMAGRIINTISNCAALSKDAEITLEANPNVL
jgi:coproporphyrinogen III oxidase-like Fe-S oxidoreductase